MFLADISSTEYRFKYLQQHSIHMKVPLKFYIVPYAEIGASFNNSHFGLLLWGDCFVCCFEFGSIRNIVSR